jgi:nicotinamidase-related amidase
VRSGEPVLDEYLPEWGGSRCVVPSLSGSGAQWRPARVESDPEVPDTECGGAMPAHPDLIDRDDLVLLVVDVQDRLASAMEDRVETAAAIVRIIRVAALIGAPIVVTRQYPEGLGGTVSEVETALAEAGGVVPVRIADKTAFCACSEPGFSELLEMTGRRQVAVVGMETHICVTQTALALVAAGYRVHVVEDACCSRHARDHGTALARLQAHGVTVTCAESLMYEAVGRAATPEFKRLLAAVKEG